MPLSQMGALKVLDREKWAKKIRSAMSAAGGRIPDAAEAIGVGVRQLFRWLQDEDFADVPRVENGLPRDGNKRGRKQGHLHTDETKQKMRAAWAARAKKDDVKRIPTRAERRAMVSR